MLYFNILVFLSVFALKNPLLCQITLEELPGRLFQKEDCYVVQIGNCDLYFYMTPEKHALSHQMAKDMEGLTYITGLGGDSPCVYELVTLTSKDPDQDILGTQIINEYGNRTKKIAEEFFGIEISGCNYDVNPNLNWECIEFHQDRLIPQYEYLRKLPLPVKPYTLVQDLTLIDWQMSPKTISGTIVQDGDTGDRYLICLFPQEAVGTFYTEPAVYLGPFQQPTYPGHVTLPFHTALTPVDFDGSYTAGAAKGKRISTVVRGVTPKEQMEKARTKAKELRLNKYHESSKQDLVTWTYDNGIIVKEHHFPPPNSSLAQSSKEMENTEIKELSPDSNREYIKKIARLFNIDEASCKKAIIKRLIKKDGGFSKLSAMDLKIAPKSTVILVNNSDIPEGFRFFNISQDFIPEGLPWIQHYQLEPNMAALIPYDVLQKLSLTPTEDIFYANEKLDFGTTARRLLQENKEEASRGLVNKIITKIDLLIFP